MLVFVLWCMWWWFEVQAKSVSDGCPNGFSPPAHDHPPSYHNVVRDGEGGDDDDEDYGVTGEDGDNNVSDYGDNGDDNNVFVVAADVSHDGDGDRHDRRASMVDEVVDGVDLMVIIFMVSMNWEGCSAHDELLVPQNIENYQIVNKL